MMSRHAWVATLDVVLLLAYVILQEPGNATGFVWHEWVGLAFIPVFVLHIVLSWSWIRTTWSRLGPEPAPRARINFLLNVSLFVMMAVVVITGLVISQYALPGLGVPQHGSQRWEQLHNFTSSLITVVVALHVALNWSWIKRAFRRYVTRSHRGEPMDVEDAA